RWDRAVYEPGTLEVKVYSDRACYEAGKCLCSESVRTAGAPAKIQLSADYEGTELIYVRAEILDADGILVPDAGNNVSFSVSGPAGILATDAGDPTSHAPFMSSSVDAFHGLASAILHRTGRGRVVVTATAEGLGSSKVGFSNEKLLYL
nr:beta-galactosidase [Bacteroidales bacterium]